MQQVIRVAAAEDPPYIIYDPKSDEWSGVFVAALDAVCTSMDLRCNYLYVSLPETAADGNETQYGTMNAVLTGMADVGLTTAGITSERMSHFDFIHSFSKRIFSVIIHQDHITTQKNSEYLLRTITSLYTRDVWVAMFAIFAFSIAVGILLDSFQTVCQKRSLSLLRISTSVCFRIYGVGLSKCGIEDYDSAKENSRPLSKVVFLVTLLFYTLVISSTLTGRLSVMFSFVTPQKLPFTDIESLAASNFTIYSNTGAIGDILNNAKTRLYSGQLVSNNRQLPRNIKDMGHYERMALAGRNALVVDEETLLKISQESCNMIVAIEQLAVVPVSCLLMAKQSPLLKMFIIGYARIAQDGIMQQGLTMFDEYVDRTSRRRPPYKYSCFQRTVSTQQQRTTAGNIAVVLENFLFLFYAQFCAVGIAFGVFLCEIAIHGFWPHQSTWLRSFPLHLKN